MVKQSRDKATLYEIMYRDLNERALQEISDEHDTKETKQCKHNNIVVMSMTATKYDPITKENQKAAKETSFDNF